MKKILYAVTKSNFGGAQRYVFELAGAAKQEGYDVSVACGGNGLLIQKLNEAGIPVHQIDSAVRDINLLKEFKTFIRLYKIIKEVKPDVVHLNSPKLGGLGSLVARMAGVKNIIYTNHGWPFMEDRPVWQKVIIKFFSWLTILFTHTVIVLSNKERDFVKHWPGAKNKHGSKIRMIRNAIKPFATQEKEESLISLLGEEPALHLIKNNKRIIGNISELHKNKGYTYALQGFRQYKEFAGPIFNTHYVIVSDGEEKEKIEHEIKNLGLEEDVTLTGYIRDAREFVKAFDFFLLSSIKEGLPYAIMEAGFACVPVISTDVGGISEVIKNYETGFLIQSAKPKEIKDVLTYIDEHPGEARLYATNLKTLLSEELSFPILTQRVFDLYETGNKN